MGGGQQCPRAQGLSPRLELTEGGGIQETTSLLHSHPGDGASDRKHSAALSLDGASGQLGDKLGSLPSEDSIQLSVIVSSGV